MKIRGFAANASDVTAIARLSRAQRAGFGLLVDGILERLCDLTAVQSVLGAVVVYVVWGLAVPILLGAGTIGFVSFATGGALFAGRSCSRVPSRSSKRGSGASNFSSPPTYGACPAANSRLSSRNSSSAKAGRSLTPVATATPMATSTSS